MAEGSNLTLPKINWDWFYRGVTISWKFEGYGSRKADTVNRILERERTGKNN